MICLTSSRIIAAFSPAAAATLPNTDPSGREVLRFLWCGGGHSQNRKGHSDLYGADGAGYRKRCPIYQKTGCRHIGHNAGGNPQLGAEPQLLQRFQIPIRAVEKFFVFSGIQQQHFCLPCPAASVFLHKAPDGHHTVTGIQKQPYHIHAVNKFLSVKPLLVWLKQWGAM